MSTEIAAKPAGSFLQEVKTYWQQLPNKTFFFVLLAAWLALFHFLGNATFNYINSSSLFVWMDRVYTTDNTVADDSHGRLIPLVVLGLMWWKRKELFAAQPLATWTPALAIVLVSLGLHMVGFLVQQTRLSVVGFYLGIFGLMGLAWGKGWLRANLFPWFLFAFAVPIGSATEAITIPLRFLVSNVVAVICRHILGIDVICEGTRLFKAPHQYEYEVAAACSGMHSLVAIMAVATIYAFMMFPGWRKKAILILSAFPLAVIGNTFRLMAIVITAEMRGQEAGAAVHDDWLWSILPYVPAVVGLVFIGRWLEGRQSKGPDPRPGATAESLTTP